MQTILERNQSVKRERVLIHELMLIVFQNSHTRRTVERYGGEVWWTSEGWTTEVPGNDGNFTALYPLSFCSPEG